MNMFTRKKKSSYTKDVLRGDCFQIGDYTYGVPDVHAQWQGANLKIGKFCSFAGGVKIILGDNHRMDWVTTFPFPAFTDQWPMAAGRQDYWFTKGDVIIGNDVWIGEDALILSGVTIGDGAVIGARTVVAKDVDPYAVVVGNPARTIRKRFSDEIIAHLLLVAWWDWSIDKIRDHLQILMSADVEALLQLHVSGR